MGRRAAIWALAVGQTLGYACLYYIFAALVLSWQNDLGWSKTTLAMGPTLAIILSSGLAPFAGRMVDKGHARTLLVGGPIVGAMGLVILALSQGIPTYLIAWAIIGLSQSATLYEVCFAFLVRRLGPDARAAIVRVTLVAGFASTLAFPAGAFLSDAFGWRTAVWVAACVVLFLQMPLNYAAAGAIRAGEPIPSAAAQAADKAALGTALRQSVFWLLGGFLALVSLNHWMMISFIVPSLVDLGATVAAAVLAASLVGPFQVAGRLALLSKEGSMSNTAALRLCLMSMGLAIVALLAMGITPVLAFAYAGFQGAAIGVMTILRPVLISDALGPTGYGAIAGTIQVLPLLAGAAGPLLGAVVLSIGGVSGLIGVSAVLVALATVLSVVLHRR